MKDKGSEPVFRKWMITYNREDGPTSQTVDDGHMAMELNKVRTWRAHHHSNVYVYGVAEDGELTHTKTFPPRKRT